MEIENFYPTGNVIAKNTYRLTVIDEDNNVVDEKTYTNISMPKNYFANNIDTLSISLGVMTAQDKKKYQDSNGYWLEDCAKRFGKDRNGNKISGYIKNTDGVAASGTDKEWDFSKEPTEDDQNLFGTTVLTGALSWKSVNVGGTTATIMGECTWGYHSPDNIYNSIEEEKNNDVNPNVLLDDPEVVVNYGGTQYRVKEKHKIYGFHFTDGGLMGGTWKNIMCTHFVINNTVKRPTDHLKLTVIVTFSNLYLNSTVKLFLPEGNNLYAHSCNTPNNNTSLLRPKKISFSGLPYSITENGVIPIVDSCCDVPFKVVETDRPNDWNTEEKGRWFGFPIYQYIGTGNFYKMKTEQDENGNKKEIISRNDKYQRIFNWSALDDQVIVNMGQNYVGPIRTLVLNGFGAAPAENYLETPPVEYIKIGVGDGKTKKFFHPFTTETGTVTDGLAVNGGLSTSATRITHYNPNQNPLSGKYFEVYSSDWKLLCTFNHMNSLHAPGENLYDNVGYHPDKKYCNFGLHPFDNNYYPVRGLIGGSGQIIVYPNFVGTIGACWVGMNSGIGFNSDLQLITAVNFTELQAGNVKRTVVKSNASNHEETVINFKSLGCLAVAGGEGWNLNSCYVGGLRYRYYDRAGIRITSGTEIEGFIEFSEPPPEGSNIYVNVTFKKPFIGSFTKIVGSKCKCYGMEEDNGTKSK